MVEPDIEGEELTQGEEVLIVAQARNDFHGYFEPEFGARRRIGGVAERFVNN